MYVEVLNSFLYFLILVYLEELKDYVGLMNYLRMVVEKFYDIVKIFLIVRYFYIGVLYIIIMF